MTEGTIVLGGAGPSAPSPQVAKRGAAAATRRLLRFLLPPATVLVLAIAGWYAVSYVVLSPERRFLLPPLHEIVRVGFLDRYNLMELLRALGLSVQVAMLGLALAVLAGVGLAVVMSQARWLERSLFPYAVVLQTVPIVALVPMFGFWFGFGFFSRVLVCVLIAIFPIIANTLFGLRSVADSHHDLFTLHHAGRLTRLVKLQIPAATPSIFTGLRIAAGLSVIGAIVGDFFFKQGQPGIGILIEIYRTQLQSERMFAAVILASLFGLTVFWTFGFLARWVVGRWHESARGDQSWG
jgi:NitT/TauT family transport system permease protein